MKHSNQPQTTGRAKKGLKGLLQTGTRTLPMLGAAVLFGMATPALADTRASFEVGHTHAKHGHSVERKLNRVARKVTRELNRLQPVSHRDRRHERRQDRYERRYDRRADRYQRNGRYNHRYNHRYNDRYFADPLYRPMSFKRWSRYHWRAGTKPRRITERNYRGYLKNYRKHYRRANQQRYWAGVERGNRGHRGR